MIPVCCRRWRVFASTYLFAVLAAQPVWACAVCFGDPNSDMVKGAKAGVIVLAVIVYGVVLTMVGVAGFWAFKARKIARTAHRTDRGHDTDLSSEISVNKQAR